MVKNCNVRKITSTIGNGKSFPPQSAKFCVWDFSEFNFATSKGLRKQL